MTDHSPDPPDRDDPIELARLLIEECERRSIAARAQHGPAQAAQGLNAELFRARQQLELAELAASENLARCVDLEGRLAAEVERLREHHHKELATAGEALQRCGMEAERLREHHHKELAAAQEALQRCGMEVERLREHHHKELAAAGEALQRSGVEAEALRLAMAELKTRAAEMETLLEQVLSSRFWIMTRPMRRFIERVRGRRWHEPRLPLLPR